MSQHIDAFWLPVYAIIALFLVFIGYKTFKFAGGLSQVIGDISAAVESIAKDVDAIKSHF